jgi:hypothetical protein
MLPPPPKKKLDFLEPNFHSKDRLNQERAKTKEAASDKTLKDIPSIIHSFKERPFLGFWLSGETQKKNHNPPFPCLIIVVIIE